MVNSYFYVRRDILMKKLILEFKNIYIITTFRNHKWAVLCSDEKKIFWSGIPNRQNERQKM